MLDILDSMIDLKIKEQKKAPKKSTKNAIKQPKTKQ